VASVPEKLLFTKSVILLSPRRWDKKTGDFKTGVIDQGVSDKRLYISEGEFAGILACCWSKGLHFSQKLFGTIGIANRFETKQSPALLYA